MKITSSSNVPLPLSLAAQSALTPSFIAAQQAHLSDSQLVHLAQCSVAKGWIVLIDPPTLVTMQQLQQVGVDLNKVIITRKLDASKSQLLRAQAQQSPNVSAVVVWESVRILH